MIVLKIRVVPKFKAALFDGTGTTVRKDGLASYVDLDFTKFAPLGAYDPSTQRLVAQSTVDGSFGIVTVSQVIAGAQSEQVITAGAVVNVAPNDGLIKLNKTVSSVTQVNLPLATTKVGPVTICDFKGDSDTYMVTIVVTGSDKLPGNLTQWIMSDAGQSITFKPLKDGTGYAVL